MLEGRHDLNEDIAKWKGQMGKWHDRFNDELRKRAGVAVQNKVPFAVPWTRNGSVKAKLALLEGSHQEVLDIEASNVSGAAGRVLSQKEIHAMSPYFEYIEAYRKGSAKVFCASEAGPMAGEQCGVAGQAPRHTAAKEKKRKRKVKTEDEAPPSKPEWWNEMLEDQKKKDEDRFSRLEGILSKYLGPVEPHNSGGLGYQGESINSGGSQGLGGSPTFGRPYYPGSVQFPGGPKLAPLRVPLGVPVGVPLGGLQGVPLGVPQGWSLGQQVPGTSEEASAT